MNTRPHIVLAFSAIMLTVIAVHPSPAQFGGLFGGPKVETISTDDLKNALFGKQAPTASRAEGLAADGSQGNFVVVDVRTKSEVDVSVIPGAITMADYEKNPSKYRGKTVIPYCTVGGRSGAYAKKLAAKGVPVKNYSGSILEWVRADLPLVTLDGQSTRRVHTYSGKYQIPKTYQQVTQ